jgi:hypothetical protein
MTQLPRGTACEARQSDTSFPLLSAETLPCELSDKPETPWAGQGRDRLPGNNRGWDIISASTEYPNSNITENNSAMQDTRALAFSPSYSCKCRGSKLSINMGTSFTITSGSRRHMEAEQGADGHWPTSSCPPPRMWPRRMFGVAKIRRRRWNLHFLQTIFVNNISNSNNTYLDTCTIKHHLIIIKNSESIVRESTITRKKEGTIGKKSKPVRNNRNIEPVGKEEIYLQQKWVVSMRTAMSLKESTCPILGKGLLGTTIISPSITFQNIIAIRE